MRALEDSPIEKVHFENIHISSEKGVVCENVRNIVFQNVSVTPEYGPVYTITNGSDITIVRNTVPQDTDIFLEVSGKISSDITIRQTVPDVSDKVTVKNGAAKEAVRIQ
jgi:hypothetical protein